MKAGATSRLNARAPGMAAASARIWSASFMLSASFAGAGLPAKSCGYKPRCDCSLLAWTCHRAERRDRRKLFHRLECLAPVCGIEGRSDCAQPHLHNRAEVRMGEDIELSRFHAFDDASAHDVGIDACEDRLG